MTGPAMGPLEAPAKASARRVPARISSAQIAAWLGPRDRVAMALGAGAAFAAALGQGWLAALPVAALGALVVAIVVIDLRHFRIPDRLSLPLIPLGLLHRGALAPDMAGLWPRLLVLAAVFAAVWAGLTLLQQGFLRLRGKAGLGGGDVKLILAAAVWLPAEQLAPYVLAASTSALIEAVVRARLQGANQDRRLAFGAHLAPWLGLFVILSAF